LIEFDTFCYLQNQKTGCTFVEQCLRTFSAEPLRLFHKHAAVGTKKPGKFYFVNVRNPIDVYLSLFNYGLDGGGELMDRLEAAGRMDLYRRRIDGFEDWLVFVLDAKNAQVVAPAYSAAVAARVGLVSYRFLRLACPGFAVACAQFSGPGDVRRYFERENILGAVIRYESLIADLEQVIDGPLRHAIKDVAGVQSWIRNTPPINPSTRRDRGKRVALTRATLAKLRAREWFMYERYYPQGKVRA
jgi:hypothetical protein